MKPHRRRSRKTDEQLFLARAPKATREIDTGARTLPRGSSKNADTADYSGSVAGVNVSLAASTAAGEGSDTLSGIENLTGSRLADELTGSDGGTSWTAWEGRTRCARVRATTR